MHTFCNTFKQEDYIYVYNPSGKCIDVFQPGASALGKGLSSWRLFKPPNFRPILQPDHSRILLRQRSTFQALWGPVAQQKAVKQIINK